MAEIELIIPDVGSQLIRLSGPSTAHVFFEGGEGEAGDGDGNGRDDVDTELVELDLVGIVPDFGVVRMRLNPSIPSPGEIEERVNDTPGILDLPPFTTEVARTASSTSSSSSYCPTARCSTTGRPSTCAR